MNELYIPKGRTMTAEHIEANVVHVKGILVVSGCITAQKIIGKGILRGDKITAKQITADHIEAGTVCCDKIAVRSMTAVELVARRSAFVSNHLQAEYVHAPKLMAYDLEVEELKVPRLISLRESSRGLLLSVFVAQLQSFFGALRHWWSRTNAPYDSKRQTAQDAEYTVVHEGKQNLHIRIVPAAKSDTDQPAA